MEVLGSGIDDTVPATVNMKNLPNSRLLAETYDEQHQRLDTTLKSRFGKCVSTLPVVYRTEDIVLR